MEEEEEEVTVDVVEELQLFEFNFKLMQLLLI